MIGAAIDNESIDGTDVYVNNWDQVAKDMWSITRLGGDWSFNEEGAHDIVAWDKTGSGWVNHFINSLPGNKVFDGWNKTIINESDIDLATEGLGGYRTFKFQY